MADDIHIASFLVQRRPADADTVRAAMAALPGIEIAIESGARVVVTAEAASTGAIADLLTRIQLLSGVMSAAMVFHHEERLEQSDEEPDDAEGRIRTVTA